MRKRFDKGPAIDAASNLRVVAMIQDHNEPYTEAEEELLRNGEAKFALFRDNAKAKKAKALTPNVKNEIAFKEGDPLGWGRSEALVRASKEEILAYVWDTEARCRWGASDMERVVLERKNDHHCIAYQCKRGSHGKAIELLPRDGVSDGVWKKVGEDAVVIVGQPTEHPMRPNAQDDRVRSLMTMSWKINEIQPGVCRVVYITKLDMGGKVPVWIMNFYLTMNLSLTYRIQSFFQAKRGLVDFDEEDGKATAEILVVKTKEEKNRRKGETRVEARLRELMGKHKGLRELGGKHEWFVVLLSKVSANKLRPAGDSNAKLCNMSAKEASVIGGALASCIAANLTAPAAVDEWILRYPAMGELDREYGRERSERKEELAVAARQRSTPATARAKRARKF
jgi:hypothetical protein